MVTNRKPLALTPCVLLLRHMILFPPWETERLFAVFDKKNSGEIDYEEFVCGLAVTCRGSWDEKVGLELVQWKIMARGVGWSFARSSNLSILLEYFAQNFNMSSPLSPSPVTSLQIIRTGGVHLQHLRHARTGCCQQGRAGGAP